MGRKIFYRKRQKLASKPIGVTFAPAALARLDCQCELTQLSRGAILSDLILSGLPPVPPVMGGAV